MSADHPLGALTRLTGVPSGFVGWTMLYLFVFLKLPIVGACWIVWWAIHQTTDTDDVPADGGPRIRAVHTRARAGRAHRAAAGRTAARGSPRRPRASAR